MLDVTTDILSPNVLNSFGQLQMIPHLTIEFKIKISEQKSRSKRMAGWWASTKLQCATISFEKLFFSKNVIFVRNGIRKSVYSDRTYRLSSFPCCILVTDRNLILFIYNLRGAIKNTFKKCNIWKKNIAVPLLYNYPPLMQTANCKLQSKNQQE